MTRLFELDFQLLHDTVLLAISVFFLCVALSYLLFEPARKLLLERARVADEMKREMIAVAAMMAAKVAAASVTPEVQNKLVEETLREMGERTWRS